MDFKGRPVMPLVFVLIALALVHRKPNVAIIRKKPIEVRNRASFRRINYRPPDCDDRQPIWGG